MEVFYKERIYLQKEMVKKLILAHGINEKIYSIFNLNNVFITLLLTTNEIFNPTKTILYSSTLLHLYYYLALQQYINVNSLTIILLEYRNLFQLSKQQISQQLDFTEEEYNKIEEGYKKPSKVQLQKIKELLHLPNRPVLLTKEYIQ